MSATILIEGGLFDPELLERLATDPETLEGQRPEDFGLAKNVRLADEIQDAFARVLSHWKTFERRRAAVGGSQSTSLTRERWVLPVLHELGFAPEHRREAFRIGGATFAVSHGEPARDGEPAVPIHIAPFEQELDERGRERLSPHAMVQELLNRSDFLWGIVSNGRRLRVLRASARITRPSFLEIDLEAIAKDELYPDFALLFRLLHRSRFPNAAGEHDCLLERWHQRAIEEGGRVKERLREGVEKALRLLGEGFLRHPESEALRQKLANGTLAAEAYWRQLLALVYRLLFLMTAEERRLLARPEADSSRYTVYERWYGVGRLRELAESRRGRDSFADLWIGLSVLFRALEEPEEAEKLGLSALDGDLFAAAACGDLEEARIANAELLEAVLELSTFVPVEGRGRKKKAGARRRVRFSAIDVEELGSVYESLLDLHPAIDLARGSFELRAGSERKTTGSYYTPDPLVQELVKSALDPVLEARLADAATPAERERALLSLRVLDPAAGSGHFLLAAARRIARELARARSGELEPAPSVRRAALRDVVRHCLFAVDKNPLAVDLAKVALWIESQTPGAPLSFLDHRVRRGDSLLGVFDREVLAKGIPDEAYAPLEGDDKAVAQGLQRVNRAERSGPQRALFDHRLEERVEALARELATIAAMPETSIEEVRAKREAFAAWQRSEARSRLALACDLWCAAFFLPKRRDTERLVPTTRHLALALEKGEAGLEPRMVAQVRAVAEEVGFFHWPLEFPEAMAAGGFDVVLGNPPWDVSQFSEQEFFATRAPDIAALQGAARKAAIARLSSERPELARAHRDALRRVKATNNLIKSSSRFPLTNEDKINLYAVFAELAFRVYRKQGRVGLIVPTGIATDANTSRFFAHIVTNRRLISLFDFENRDRIFPAVDSRQKFALLTLGSGLRMPDFLCFATAIDQLRDDRRHFSLSPEDIGRINPNTKTLPIFRSKADAELTTRIYARVPVLIREIGSREESDWGAVAIQNFFSTSNRVDQQLFVVDTEFDPSDTSLVPVRRGTMIWQFDHQAAVYDPVAGKFRDTIPSERLRPGVVRADKYVPLAEVCRRLARIRWARRWLLGWRDTTNATNERTLVASVLPFGATDDTLSILLPKAATAQQAAMLLGSLNSLVVDYVAQQKVGGTHVRKYVIAQLPILPPSVYSEPVLALLLPRILELTYTAHDMRPWAEDLGYEGEPFPWDPERRARLRAELDAYYAFLYGLSRDELRYVLDPADVMGADYPSETFRVLKEKEERTYGEYRTRRLVLEAWDRFVAEGVFDPERESGLSPHERDRARLGRLRGGA